MKAIVCTEYGSPDVLQLKEVENPTPKDNEVVAKVHAASLNAADFETLRGVPIVRIASPRKPMYKILGSDIAGRVEVVGKSVRQFQPGDEIWGDLSAHGFGTFAEYVCVPESALRLKPASMTFEEAATVPTAAVVALQNLLAGPSLPSPFLSDKGQIQPGQKVLINGAGGGVGTFAVQIAKSFGAEVTGVDSARKLDMLRSIGADHVIDYTQEDFVKSGQRYDLILDVVAHRSIFACKRALGPNGIYAFVGGSTAAIFQAFLLGPLISMTGSRRMGIRMWEPNKKEDLDFLQELFEAGKVVPVIDRRYRLSEVPEAMRYLEEGHVLGKLVITSEHNRKT
ncbi:MAG: NAD(P)-dependent alcohol dehydrogenase [Candidatus Thorarchaeota archaeon]|jgi:NADPH:quinone reductase-like Zn-dependent oxidoreductase